MVKLKDVAVDIEMGYFYTIDLEHGNDQLSSLIKRALQLRRLQEGKPAGPGSDELFESDSGISEQEREKIIVELNELVDKTRIDIKPNTFSYVSQRKGSTLPILVNVLAVSALVIAGALVLHLFDLREDSIAKPAQVETAEAEVIEEVKRQAEQQISEKELQIASIQGNLEQLKSERDLFLSEAEAELRAKEEALRTSFEEALEAERQRLQREGLSQEEIDQLIKEKEAEMRAELDNELEALRAQLESQRREREAILNAEIARYESELRESILARSDLIDRLETQRAELEQRYQEREEALAAERDLLSAQLESARIQREKGDSALRQILGFYERVNAYLAENDTSSAIRELDDLESFLNNPSRSALPVIQERQKVELFLIASLRTLIENERAEDERQAKTVSPEAMLLASVNSTVEEGDRYFDAGDTDTAERLYLNALQKIASVQRSYLRLGEIRNLSSKLESQELAKKIEEGDAFYNAQEYQAALDSYGGALAFLDVDSVTAERMLERILDVGYRIGISREQSEIVRDSQELIGRAESIERRQREILERLVRVQQSYLASIVDIKAGDITPTERLIPLIQAKVRVKQILDSDPIRSVYPELYEQMDEYLLALSKEQHSIGYAEALSDVNALVGVLSGVETEDNLQKTWTNIETRDQADSVSAILESLQKMLEQTP